LGQKKAGRPKGGVLLARTPFDPAQPFVVTNPQAGSPTIEGLTGNGFQLDNQTSDYNE
jgi:hypothetical protein